MPKRSVGRPSNLTPELVHKIRTRVIDGIPNVEIQRELGISVGSWSNWMTNNTNDFRTNLTAWKAERHLNLAEEQVPKILEQDKSMASKTSMTMFILETVGKDVYSKKLPEPPDPSTFTHVQLIGKIIAGFAAIGVTNIDDLRRRISEKRQQESSTFNYATQEAEGDDASVTAYPIDARRKQIG